VRRRAYSAEECFQIPDVLLRGQERRRTLEENDRGVQCARDSQRYLPGAPYLLGWSELTDRASASLGERHFQFAIRRARRMMGDQLPGLQAETKVRRSVSPPLLRQSYGGRPVECALQLDCPELLEIPGMRCGPPTTPDPERIRVTNSRQRGFFEVCPKLLQIALHGGEDLLFRNSERCLAAVGPA